jgi:hypothetical protein
MEQELNKLTLLFTTIFFKFRRKVKVYNYVSNLKNTRF